MEEYIKKELLARGYDKFEIDEIEKDYLDAEKDGIKLDILTLYEVKKLVGREYYISEDGNFKDRYIYMNSKIF